MSVALNLRPKVRQDLEFKTEVRQDEEFVVVTDPWGLQSHSLLLSDKVHALLKMFDGKRTLAEIERGFALRHNKDRFSLSELTSIVEQFDHHLLLDNARYREAFEHQVKHFLESSVRLPAHAGISYPEEADALRKWVDEILAAPDGDSEMGIDQSTLAAVVAPHLDPRVETTAYGDAYRGLRGMSPERIVLLGTGHSMRSGLFSLTFKSYFTPLGEVPTDLDAVDHLLDAGQMICSPHDLAHRTEHALEFQLPFLQRVLARPDIPIVPILCGSMHRWFGEAKKVEDVPYLPDFIRALREIITPNTLVVAGVDFAHIGHKFGHSKTGRGLYEASNIHDQKLLESLCAGNAGSFWQRNASARDKYNVCGFSSLSLLLAAMPSLQGQIKRHGYWFEDETNSAVSFAAVHLHRA